MSEYFKNVMDNALLNHWARCDNIGKRNELKNMRKHLNKHIPRGKCFHRMFECR